MSNLFKPEDRVQSINGLWTGTVHLTYKDNSYYVVGDNGKVKIVHENEIRLIRQPSRTEALAAVQTLMEYFK